MISDVIKQMVLYFDGDAGFCSRCKCVGAGDTCFLWYGKEKYTDCTIDTATFCLQIIHK